MPPKHQRSSYVIGSSSFNPDDFFEAWDPATSIPQDNDLQSCIIRAFGLRPNDDYIYHAMASVTLAQVQAAIGHGGKNGLHAWYYGDEGAETHPPPLDITAYTTIFSPQSSTSKSLTTFTSNARKSSLRSQISSHLSSRFHSPQPPFSLAPKSKSPPKNPYLDLWTWSCHNLEWAGPTPSTAKLKHSHHILPVLYHHFGCVIPTSDALHLISQAARGGYPVSTQPATSQPTEAKGKKKPKPPLKPILDLGSGAGYWTYLLRRTYPDLLVHAVDNHHSVYRTSWLPDTISADAATYLASHSGGHNCVLLLLYPQTMDDFTGRVLRAYDGDIIVLAGTQCEAEEREGGWKGPFFTGFRDETVESWLGREQREREWRKVAQVPLPSFAGKDEGLFVFVRGKRGGLADGGG